MCTCTLYTCNCVMQNMSFSMQIECTCTCPSGHMHVHVHVCPDTCMYTVHVQRIDGGSATAHIIHVQCMYHQEIVPHG